MAAFERVLWLALGALIAAIAGGLNVDTAANVNGRANVQSYSGATADMQIAACLAANTICDARGYGNTTQTIAATVEIGISGAYKQLIVSQSTTFEPLNASVNMFQLDHNGVISGKLFIQFPSSMTYSGKAFMVTDTVGYWQNYPSLFKFDSIHIDASKERGGGTRAGYGVWISPPTGSFIQSTNFGEIQINGLEYGVYLNASGKNTYINGNSFSNLQLTENGNALTLNCASALEIAGNTFSNLQIDGLGPGITYTGSCHIRHNTFSPAYIWDTRTPISNSGASAHENKFVGHIDNAVTDPQSIEAAWPFQNTYELTNGDSAQTIGVLYINKTRGAWSHAENSGSLGWSASSMGELDYYQNVWGNNSWWSHEFWVPNSSNTGWTSAGGFLQNGQFVASHGAALSGKVTIGGATILPLLNTTATVAPGRFTANSKTAQTAIPMSGLTTSCTIQFTPSSDFTTVAGWGTTGGLAIFAWPTSNTVNWYVINQTGSTVSPAASVTFNVSAKC